MWFLAGGGAGEIYRADGWTYCCSSTYKCTGRVDASVTGIDAGHPFRLAEFKKAVVGHDCVDSDGWCSLM